MDWHLIATAPKDGSWFITFTPSPGEPFDFAVWEEDYQDFCKVGCGYQYATHWAPMPPPPAPIG
ncbi:hypothetical protein BH10PSE12_BH10PSE12_02830 [soil metagenome]